MDLRFTDTVYGDAVVAYRDNRGRGPSTGPNDQFVSVHPRMIQSSTGLFDLKYSTPEFRSSRLTIASSASRVEGISKETQDILAITDFHVIPMGGEGRLPFLFLSMVVVQKSNPDIYTVTESMEVDVCGTVNIQRIVQSMGVMDPPLARCDLGSFFASKKGAGYIPISFASVRSETVILLMVPTQPGFNLQVVEVQFSSSQNVRGLSSRAIATPESFSSNSKLPTALAWSEFSR